MVCSAPEMTTVSKPNRNPASADVTDQRKIRPLIRLFCLESSGERRASPEPHVDQAPARNFKSRPITTFKVEHCSTCYASNELYVKHIRSSWCAFRRLPQTHV